MQQLKSEQIVDMIIDGVESCYADGIDDMVVEAHKNMLRRSKSSIAFIISRMTGCDGVKADDVDRFLEDKR